jgi:hypothetical protein
VTPISIKRLSLLTLGVVAACAVGWTVAAGRRAAAATTPFAEERTQRIRSLTTERDRLARELTAVKVTLAGYPAQIAVEEDRIRQADRVIRELRELESMWDKLVGNPEQQRANAEQIGRMNRLRTEAQGKIALLKEETQRTTWEKDGLDIELAGVASRLSTAERSSSAIGYYLALGWRDVRGWLITALALNAAVIGAAVARARRVAKA